MAYQAAKESFSRDEILEILRRNVELYRNEPTFVNYIVDLAIYLLEVQEQSAMEEAGSQDLDPLSSVGLMAVKIPASAGPAIDAGYAPAVPAPPPTAPPSARVAAVATAPPAFPLAPVPAPAAAVAAVTPPNPPPEIELASVQVFPRFLDTTPGYADDQDPLSTPGSYPRRSSSPSHTYPPAQSPAAAAYRESVSGGSAGGASSSSGSPSGLFRSGLVPPTVPLPPSSTGGFLNAPAAATQPTPIRQAPTPQSANEKTLPKAKNEQAPRTRIYKVFRSHTSSVEVPKCPICGSETRGSRTCLNCGHIL